MEKLGSLLETQSLAILLGLTAMLLAVGLLRRYVLRQPLDLFAMWGETRMVVYAAVAGALYFAVLVPFKFAVLVPGLTEIRPGAALPMFLSFIFGPAAAWGAGMGNFIGDFFGMFGPGSLFGFFGNFLLGYVPYALYRTWVGHRPPIQAGDHPLTAIKNIAVIVVGVIVASFACATFIAWGAHLIGLAPFLVLAPIILLNNALVGLALSLPLVLLLYRRAEKWGVMYYEVMEPEQAKPARLANLGAILLIFGAVGGWLIGFGVAKASDKPAAPAVAQPEIAPEVSVIDEEAASPEQSPPPVETPPVDNTPLAVGLSVAPAILLMLIGVFLL